MENYIVTREVIEEINGVSKTHFLDDNAKRVNKSLGDLTGLNGFGFHIIEIQPGHGSSQMHMHYCEDECVYVLEGEAEAFIGDERYPVKAGDFIGYRAGGEAHALFNNSDSLFRCIVVGQRLEHDVCDYPKVNKRLFRNIGMPWNLVDIDDINEPKRS